MSGRARAGFLFEALPPRSGPARKNSPAEDLSFLKPERTAAPPIVRTVQGSTIRTPARLYTTSVSAIGAQGRTSDSGFCEGDTEGSPSMAVQIDKLSLPFFVHLIIILLILLTCLAHSESTTNSCRFYDICFLCVICFLFSLTLTSR